MTTDTLEQLKRSALRGDAPALKQLFQEGDQLLAAGDYAGAAALLKESAISYRIDLFRERARTEELEQEARQLEVKLNFKSKLLKTHHAGVDLACPAGADLSFENIARAWHRLEWNDDLAAACACLTELWLKEGVRFSSPGGSVARRVITTVKCILESARKRPSSLPRVTPSEELIVIEPIVRAIVPLL